MRIIHLTPGTGTFHCGSCLRDNALIKALRARGHDAVMVPLYLPLVTDDEPANPELSVQVGGISLYLEQRVQALGKMPGWLRRFLDAPARLRGAANRMGMTSPKDLGAMTLSSLQGMEGRQSAGWGRLVQWIAELEEKPDLVSLSNGLLLGLTPAIRQQIACPVVASLQGEDAFLDTLPEPYREQCWEALAELAKGADGLIAASAFYAEQMETRLGLSSGSVQVVPNGMDFSDYKPVLHRSDRPSIGYLARMCQGKGLETLVDAFILLRQRNRVIDLGLRIAGAATPVDDAFIAGLKVKLENAGHTERVEWLPNLGFAEKVNFLGDLSVLSVPADYGEAFGLYVIEAMACGTPVVQPRDGGFAEILARAPGGVLYDIPAEEDGGSTHAAALADALEDLLSDQETLEELRAVGRHAVLDYYTAERMAEDFETVCEGVYNK